MQNIWSKVKVTLGIIKAWAQNDVKFAVCVQCKPGHWSNVVVVGCCQTCYYEQS